jgi:Uncharacterized protein with conserved CXXC pairs
MICQVCKSREATTHIKSILNGKLAEIHLCSDCAKEKGYGDVLGGFGIANLLGNIFVNSPEFETEKRCSKCKSSFEDISKKGKIGCADCYETFIDQLAPMIKRIHGTANHRGKHPGRYALRVQEEKTQIMPVKEPPLENKRRELKQAIEAQNFEQAAVLRDEIKELEKND